MAEAVNTEGQSQSAAEPSTRDQIINRLRAERGEDPLPTGSDREPQKGEDPTRGQPDGNDGSQDDLPSNQGQAQSQETSDDGEYETDDFGDEGETDGDEESGASADDGVEGEEEPTQSADTIEALLVDDRQYTAEDIRNLENRNREMDADYRRKTTVNNRIRREYEATGAEMNALSNYFVGLAEANITNLDSMDPSQMDQQQFAAWKQQREAAARGATELKSGMDKVRGGIRDQITNMRKHQAAESAEIMAGIESRWGTEFYGKIRDFAVDSGRYTPESFQEVRDWQTLEGLVALYDANEARKKMRQARQGQTARDGGEQQGKSSNEDEPGRKPRRRRNRQRRSKNSGQFQNAQQAAMESPSSIADGSFRSAMVAKLQRERGE